MIGLDTNVLLRFFLRDEPDQSARATALMSSLSVPEPGFISSVTLVESVWVLERLYRKQKHEVVLFLRGLLESQQLVVENHDSVAQALRKFGGSNADFADCLIERLCHAAGCTRTMTFDFNASKSSGMVLL
jgi:predicted nucleic-acid-binding protein